MLSFRKKFSFTSNKAAPVVEDSNEVLMEGLLDKRGGGTSTFGRQSWKKRWWRLTSTMLSYYEDQVRVRERVGLLVSLSIVVCARDGGGCGDGGSSHRLCSIRTARRTYS